MRLSANQKQLLRQTLRRRFGEAARLWVFGSRLDPQVRGGDFDLMVEAPGGDADQLVDARLRFLADLQASPLFEGEKVDLILHAPDLGDAPLAIHRVARRQGVELS
jgi:predicted nucleotidyltransferase